MENLNTLIKDVITKLIDSAEKSELEKYRSENEIAKLDAEKLLESNIDSIRESLDYGYENVNDCLSEFEDSYREWSQFHIEEARIKDRWKKVREEFLCQI